MNTLLKSNGLKRVLIVLLLLNGFMASYAQAKMIPTLQLIQSQDMEYSQQDLQTALASDELKQQLTDMGVDVTQLNDRIASLTASEIQQLNAELAEQPAGGIVGVLVTIFVVFIVTDMLCATDVFAFVKCINK